MPIDNSLPDKKFPMSFKHGDIPVTYFYEHLNKIRVKLIDCPSVTQLMQYIPEFSLATWEDNPRDDYTTEERIDAIKKLFQGKLLPTAMETIGLTFLISNIDSVDVTHLIRHRTMSFSAHCTGDRDQRHDDCVIKSSINSHYLFKERYKRLVRECKQLYADMVDSKEISILDARTILPKSLVNHYYARVNLKDFIGFLHQRLDRQIQPESDNIVALKMLIEANKKLPGIKDLVNIQGPDQWFVKTAQTGHSSNLYMPEVPRNDVFRYKEQWFIYKKQRSEMLGGNTFVKLWKSLVEELNNE